MCAFLVPTYLCLVFGVWWECACVSVCVITSDENEGEGG